jgi:F-type H+-transporting ATPase subunit b
MTSSILASAFGPEIALVAAASAAPQSADAQLMDVDGTLFVMLGIFVVLAFVLNKVFWGPYLKVKEQRVLRVDGYREQAKGLEAEAKTRFAKVEAELAEARRIGSAERGRTRVETQAREQAIVAEALASAQKTLADARARVEAAVTAERAALKARAEALGRDAAERVLGRKVS